MMSRNVRSKTLAIFVVLTMLMTTVTTLRYVTNVDFIAPAEATIGVDEWQNNSNGGEILNMSTDDLYYGNTVTLKFNGSVTDERCYLYKPNYYVKQEGYELKYGVNWTMVESIDFQSSDEPEVNVELDRAGLWIVIPVPQGYVAPEYIGAYTDTPVNMTDMTFYNVTNKWENILGWFWVNSTSWDIDLSTTEVTYDANNSLEITVTYSNGDKVEDAFWIDIWHLKDSATDFNDGSAELVYHKEVKASEEGKWSISGEFMYRLTHDTGAGVYQIVAYRDAHPGHSDKMYGDEGFTSGDRGYNNTFGNDTIWTKFSSSNILNNSYDWDTCGPFDPPEYLTKVNFTVIANEPILEVKNETQYYNFSCEITGNVTITVKDSNGNYMNLSSYNVSIYLFNSSTNKRRWNPINSSYYNCSISDANITLGPDLKNSSGWGVNRSGAYIWAKKGTVVYVVVAINTIGDSEPEWNGTATFTITSAPELEIVWEDDDGDISDENNKDGVIPRVPYNDDLPLWIKFYVITGSEDNFLEDSENITISGDALFLENGMSLEKYNDTFNGNVVKCETIGDKKVWNVSIIPLMDVNGGEITITAKKGDKTVEKTLYVGGTELNGTIVSISPTDFFIGENQTITVTVTGPEGIVKYPNADVCLYYLDTTGDGLKLASNYINHTTKGTTSGEYSFLFNTTQQTENQTAPEGPFTEAKAPRYVVAYANVTHVGAGYAVSVMKPKNDLKVEVSKDKFMAGQSTTFWINVSVVGNETSEPDTEGLHILIYNESGENVTGEYGWPDWDDLSEDTSLEFTVAINQTGTYTIYAYNNTHDSEGYNATIYVAPVQVTCDPSEFIWSVDDNITATLTVTWQGQPVNGTLKIYNITDVGTYNKTWVNYTAGGNDTIELEVINGVATLHNITAEYLPEDKGLMNITFEFKPEESGSVYAKAEGTIPVKVPDVEPTPDAVAVGEMTTVNVLVTGRGQPLPGVNVTLKGAGIKSNATTDASGVATFSFLPGSTGYIDILIENRSTGTKINVTANYLEIEIPSSVQEGIFTVTIKDGKGNLVKGAQVKFTGTGETKITDSNGQVSFNISIPGTIPYATYKLIATKPGYRSDEESIIIMNIFNLYISVPSKASPGQKITVKVTSDAGQVYGVKITLKKGTQVIETKTLTGPEGVSFTIPQVKKKTTFTIVAEKEGYKSATYDITVTPGGIPGFELVTLIAAIGVAFVLLRRRHQ